MNTPELDDSTKLLGEYRNLRTAINEMQGVERSLDLAVRFYRKAEDRDLDLPDIFFWGLPLEAFERVCEHLLEGRREKLQALGVTGL